jgi:hypothetical protein
MFIIFIIFSSWILITHVVFDHNRAPDHNYYMTLSLDSLDPLWSSNDYSSSWAILVKLFHIELFDGLFQVDKIPFISGAIFYYFGLFICSKGLNQRHKIIFWIGSIFSYTHVISLSLDKTSLVFLVFAIAYMTRQYFKYNISRIIILSLLSLILIYIRGWLLPFMWLLFFHDKLNFNKKIYCYIFLFLLISVLLTTLIYLTGDIRAPIRYLLAFLFVFIDPLPKDSDKFFESGLIFFSLVSFLVRGSMLLYMFKYIKRIVRYGGEIFLFPIILPFFIITTSYYFEITGGINFGYTSDAVRKAAFFWPILIVMVLKFLQKSQGSVK